MHKDPPDHLVTQLDELGLCNPRQFRAVQGRVRRLTRDLPAFDRVWLDALVQARRITPFQADRFSDEKGPENEVSLTCGGVEMVEAGGDPVSGELDDSGDGTQLGKRYVDEEDTIEVLCTKPGSGSLGVDGNALELKDAKPLPASD